VTKRHTETITKVIPLDKSVFVTISSLLLDVDALWSVQTSGPTTPSNACYARSPSPFWASKQNHGQRKRQCYNRQLKIQVKIRMDKIHQVKLISY